MKNLLKISCVIIGRRSGLLFLLFVAPVLLGHGREGLFGLFDQTHADRFLGWFDELAFRVGEGGSGLGRFGPLYFVCGGFYRELVFYFLRRLLYCLVFLHELIGQAVGCGPGQFFYILFAAVFSP